MNGAPLPQPAPFTCSNCGAPLPHVPALCPACGSLISGRRRPSHPSSKRRVVAFSALLIWVSVTLVMLGALLMAGLSQRPFSLQTSAPVLVMVIVILGGLLAAILLFSRRKH